MTSTNSLNNRNNSITKDILSAMLLTEERTYRCSCVQCSLCSGMHTFYLRLRVAIVLSLLLSQAPIKQLWQQIHCLWYKQPESVWFKPKTLQHYFNYSANTPTGCRLPFHFNHSTGKIITAQALYYRLNAVYLIFCSLIVLTGSFKQKSMGKKGHHYGRKCRHTQN